MDILTIAPTYSPSSARSQDRYLTGLARALAGAGHEILVLTASDEGAFHGRLPPGVRVLTPSESWPLFHYEQSTDTILDNVRLVGEALELAAETTFDLLWCHTWQGALAADLMRNRLWIPLALYLHGTQAGRDTGEEGSVRRYVCEMEEWACGRSDALVCPSESAVHDVCTSYGISQDHLHVVPVSPDFRQFEPAGTDLDDFRALLASPDEPILLYAGALEETNAPHTLLEALPSVLAERPNVRLVFAGRGPASEALMKRAEASGVADRCLFAGEVSERVLGAFYRTCDLLVAPASFAPSGRSVQEAMGLGLPPVVSDVGAHRVLISDGITGLRVRPGNPDAWAGNLVWALENPERLGEMGKEAEEFARDLPSPECTAARFAEVAGHLAADAGRGAAERSR